MIDPVDGRVAGSLLNDLGEVFGGDVHLPGIVAKGVLATVVLLDEFHELKYVGGAARDGWGLRSGGVGGGDGGLFEGHELDHQRTGGGAEDRLAKYGVGEGIGSIGMDNGEVVVGEGELPGGKVGDGARGAAMGNAAYEDGIKGEVTDIVGGEGEKSQLEMLGVVVTHDQANIAGEEYHIAGGKAIGLLVDLNCDPTTVTEENGVGLDGLERLPRIEVFKRGGDTAIEQAVLITAV